MDNTKSKIKQGVSFFFRNITWKKCLTFFAFLLLSIFFWIMQIYREKFEANFNIPIKYTNIPDSIFFEEDLPSSINAIIRDDGSVLFRYLLTKKNDSIEINVRELVNNKRNSTKLNIQGENLVLLIREKLFGGTELISYSPSYISSPFVVMQHKKVPVKFNGKIEPQQGYIIDGDITFEPEDVTVYSSKKVLDTIFFANTVDDTIFGLTHSASIPIAIENKTKIVKYTPDSIRLNVPIDQFNVKEVAIPIICSNVPKRLSVKFFPSTAKVIFTVGLKRYQEATEEKFVINVDYNDIVTQNNSSISPQLTQNPDYVIIQSIEPKQVEYIIEKE